jgi:hypothetical protein
VRLIYLISTEIVDKKRGKKEKVTSLSTFSVFRQNLFRFSAIDPRPSTQALDRPSTIDRRTAPPLFYLLLTDTH